MQSVLFDSSVYISALRRGRDSTLPIQHLTSQTILWLSSVVLAELYAGVYDEDLELLERWEDDFEKAERILVPSLQDWTQSGRALSRVARRYGYKQIRQSQLINDTLIATSAGRMGVLVVTENVKDFSRLSEFIDFDWQAAPQ
jgi:predicted nucleic acid-binding protein